MEQPLFEREEIRFLNETLLASYRKSYDADKKGLSFHINRPPLPQPDLCEEVCSSLPPVCRCCVRVLQNDTDPDVEEGFDELTVIPTGRDVEVQGSELCYQTTMAGSYVFNYTLSDGSSSAESRVEFRFI